MYITIIIRSFCFVNQPTRMFSCALQATPSLVNLYILIITGGDKSRIFLFHEVRLLSLPLGWDTFCGNLAYTVMSVFTSDFVIM
jgi:hypothetical protein